MNVSQKQVLRDRMKKRRRVLVQQNSTAKDRAVRLFFDFFTFSPQTIIGGYWPMGSEFDIRPLLNHLVEKGFLCALPCLSHEELLFREWAPSDVLVQGNFQIFEPPSSSFFINPDVLLVPLLAFDKKGNRLGYGQGHYDRYLHHRKVLTIGVGFAGQEVESIPCQPHDALLDYILTEKDVIKCGHG